MIKIEFEKKSRAIGTRMTSRSDENRPPLSPVHPLEGKDEIYISCIYRLGKKNGEGGGGGEGGKSKRQWRRVFFFLKREGYGSYLGQLLGILGLLADERHEIREGVVTVLGVLDHPRGGRVLRLIVGEAGHGLTGATGQSFVRRVQP